MHAFRPRGALVRKFETVLPLSAFAGFFATLRMTNLDSQYRSKKKRMAIAHYNKNECGPGQPPEPHKACCALPGPSALRGCAAGLPQLAQLREEGLPSAVAGFDACTPAANESVFPFGTTLIKVSFECRPVNFSAVRANPTLWRNRSWSDSGSHQPRDACPKGSGQFHASSADTLPEVRGRHNRDSSGLCAKAVGSESILWKIEEKAEGILVEDCVGRAPSPAWSCFGLGNVSHRAFSMRYV